MTTFAGERLATAPGRGRDPLYQQGDAKDAPSRVCVTPSVPPDRHSEWGDESTIVCVLLAGIAASCGYADQKVC
jgi:hypothetical protein